MKSTFRFLVMNVMRDVESLERSLESKRVRAWCGVVRSWVGVSRIKGV